MQTSAPRVLAFNCSRHRPLMLRHLILQLRHQTYPVDMAIYVNSSETEHLERVNYVRLIQDAAGGFGGGRVFVKYGPSLRPQENWMQSLGQVNIEDYDLFLKVDDDDIYLQSYVEDVVADFVAHRWDYSGAISAGLLNGYRWYPDVMVEDLGFQPEDIALNIPRHMPPSTAFSREAAKVIMALQTDSKLFEDILWRRLAASTPGLKFVRRGDRNFIYNVHGGNASTAQALEP